MAQSPNIMLNDSTGDGDDHDPHYEPIISLPEVITSTNEECEEELIKLRAKLFRYDKLEDPPEWKEKGIGDVKLLRHLTKNTVRVVMRRDKTLKICANFFITPTMELKKLANKSERDWIWSSFVADFTNEVLQPEMLAIRFADAENAKKWKDAFEEAKTIVATECELYKNDNEDSSDEGESENEKEVTETLDKLQLNDSKTNESINNESVNDSINKVTPVKNEASSQEKNAAEESPEK